MKENSGNKSGLIVIVLILVIAAGGLLWFYLYQQRKANDLEKDLEKLKKTADQAAGNSDQAAAIAANIQQTRQALSTDQKTSLLSGAAKLGQVKDDTTGTIPKITVKPGTTDATTGTTLKVNGQKATAAKTVPILKP